MRLEPATSMLLRATTFPGSIDVPARPEALDKSWIAQVWEVPVLRAAITVASRDLADRIEDVLAQRVVDAATVGRLAMSLATYVLRWRGRSTPFGMFAGVSAANVGPAAVGWGDGHQVHRRVDGGWLGLLLARLEADPNILASLDVTATPGIEQRGSRVVAPGRPPDTPAAELAPVEVSARASAPVREVLSRARGPVSVRHLVSQLADTFHATPDAVTGMVTNLVDQGLLTTSLRPPAQQAAPINHVITALESIGTPQHLRQVGAVLAGVRDRLSTPMPVGVVDDVDTDLKALATVPWVPVAHDTVLDASITVPQAVGREVADAVTLIHRLSPGPWGEGIWRDYRAAFRARYATGSIVPVLDLVSDAGLGYPAGYLAAATEPAAQTMSPLTHRVQALVLQAVIEGHDEIELTRDVIDHLVDGEPVDELRLPWRTEAAFSLEAPDLDAIRRGRFTVRITGLPRAGSSMIGRHLQFLPETDREPLAATFESPHALAAQLAFVPRKRRNENITRTGGIVEHTIALDEPAHHADPGCIPLSDLGVTDQDGLRLVRMSDGAVVAAFVPHPLEARAQTPVLARFLTDLATESCATNDPFHRLATSHLPYVPRIRYRRTILAPATWRLSPMAVGNDPCGLERWRKIWQVPRHVEMVENEQRLPLDLDHPVHQALFADRLRTREHLELREASVPKSLGWIGRAHELVVPLAPASARPPQSIHSQDTDVGLGSDIVRVDVVTHPARADEVLLEHVPDLLAAIATQADHWWFWRERNLRRPQDPPRIALCVAAAETGLIARVAGAVERWCRAVSTTRLASGWTLGPHTGHDLPTAYNASNAAAHALLQADSEAALAEVAHAPGMTERVGLAAAGAFDLATAVLGSADSAAHHLVNTLPARRGRLDPAMRAAALHADDRRSDEVVRAWRHRTQAVHTLLAGSDRTMAPPLVTRLLHGHQARAMGLDAETEHTVQRLARLVALQHLARAPQVRE